jgi:hypothetical protein
MKLPQVFVAVIGLSFLAALRADDKLPENKLPEPIAKAVEKADEVVLYSLSGKTDERDGWHGAKVLGTTTVKEPAVKKSLSTALVKSVSEGAGGTRNFSPLHGLRARYDGKTYDLLISFECHWLYVYVDDSDKPQVLLIGDAPQNELNKILTSAKVELAKPKK